MIKQPDFEKKKRINNDVNELLLVNMHSIATG